MTSSQKQQVNEIHVPMTSSLKHKFMNLMYLWPLHKNVPMASLQKHNEIHVPMTSSLKHKFMSLMCLVSSWKQQVHDIHVPMTSPLKHNKSTFLAIKFMRFDMNSAQQHNRHTKYFLAILSNITDTVNTFLLFCQSLFSVQTKAAWNQEYNFSLGFKALRPKTDWESKFYHCFHWTYNHVPLILTSYSFTFLTCVCMVLSYSYLLFHLQAQLNGWRAPCWMNKMTPNKYELNWTGYLSFFSSTLNNSMPWFTPQ